MRSITILLIAACIAAAGCAASAKRMTSQEDREQFLQYAAAPVDNFNYLGRYDSWRALSNDTLVVWTTFNNAYLLKVRQPCVGLRFAQSIGLSSTNNTVAAGLDSVRFGDNQNCFIDEIRPVDYRKMQADRKAARQKSV